VTFEEQIVRANALIDQALSLQDQGLFDEGDARLDVAAAVLDHAEQYIWRSGNASTLAAHPMPDNLTKEQRSRAMSRIRSRETQPELTLRRGLREAGLLGYRLHVKRLPGNPDVVWIGRKVAVFVDGAFFHGHPSAYTPGKSGEYWDLKIARNVARDRASDEALRELGWTVLRFWDFEIRRDLTSCIERVREAHARATLPARVRPEPST